MAIQISGTTVVDNSRNFTNIESVSGNGIATQAEAEAGTVNDQIMTPLRVSQAISALGGGGDSGVDDDINWSTCNVGCAVRGGGNVFYKSGGLVWIIGPSTTQQPGTWPMGYCSGLGGGVVQLAERISGRSGWFVPDCATLKTSYNCRTYWDTYSTGGYHSSSERDNTGNWMLHFSTGGYASVEKPCQCCVRPMRVICY